MLRWLRLALRNLFGVVATTDHPPFAHRQKLRLAIGRPDKGTSITCLRHFKIEVIRSAIAAKIVIVGLLNQFIFVRFMQPQLVIERTK